MTQVYVESHNGIGKSFEFNIDSIWSAQVDYDDVDHAEVDAATNYLKDLVKDNWKEYRFKEYFKEELIKDYNDNSELTDHYPTLEDYLNARL